MTSERIVELELELEKLEPYLHYCGCDECNFYGHMENDIMSKIDRLKSDLATAPKVSISEKIRTALDDLLDKTNVIMDSTRRLERKMDRELDLLRSKTMATMATTDRRPRPRSKGISDDVNGLHLIRELNDKAVEQEIEKAKLAAAIPAPSEDDVVKFLDVDPAPSSVLRGLHLDDVNTAVAPSEDDVAATMETIGERLAVVESKTDPEIVARILSMSSQCGELGLAALLVNVLDIDGNSDLADDMMQQITDADPVAAQHVLIHMMQLIFEDVSEND